MVVEGHWDDRCLHMLRFAVRHHLSRLSRVHAAHQIYNGLIAALHGVLKTPIPADDLKRVVNSMRGHMGRPANSP